MPLIYIDPQSRRHKAPCGECHIKDGETCDVCNAYQLQSTQAMRDRFRELTAVDGKDDYDRAARMILDDLEALLKRRDT